jgi:putative membrane protein insertion efficiency factor
MSSRNLQQAWVLPLAERETAPSRDSQAAARSSFRPVTAALLLVIIAYKRFVSPLLGPSCRFHPTCSTYAMEAIRRYGPLGGAARALARLARCHPFSQGGFDPVR